MVLRFVHSNDHARTRKLRSIYRELGEPGCISEGKIAPKRAILGILLDVMVIRLDFTRTWPPFSRDRAGHLHALLVGAAPVANEGSEADSWR